MSHVCLFAVMARRFYGGFDGGLGAATRSRGDDPGESAISRSVQRNSSTSSNLQNERLIRMFQSMRKEIKSLQNETAALKENTNKLLSGTTDHNKRKEARKLPNSLTVRFSGSY